MTIPNDTMKAAPGSASNARVQRSLQVEIDRIGGAAGGRTAQPKLLPDIVVLATSGGEVVEAMSSRSPPPTEPARETGLGLTVAKIMALNTLNSRAFRNPLEERTLGESRDGVAKWVKAATAGGRDELLRMALEAHSAVVHEFARNTGRRHLSEVRITLRSPLPIPAESAFQSTRWSRIPDRPRAWASMERGGILGEFRLPTPEYNHSVAVEEHVDEVEIDLGPFTLPQGNDEEVATLILAIPRPPVGDAIDGTWRVVAREGVGDETGEFRVDVGPETLDHVALAKAAKAHRWGVLEKD